MRAEEGCQEQVLGGEQVFSHKYYSKSQIYIITDELPDQRYQQNSLYKRLKHCIHSEASLSFTKHRL